jgi:coatomer protein complex subunit alpha (xenin)
VTCITCRARTLQSALVELSEGYRFVSGKLPEAQTTFRSVLQGLLLVFVSSDEEAKEVSRVQNVYLFLIT